MPRTLLDGTIEALDTARLLLLEETERRLRQVGQNEVIGLSGFLRTTRRVPFRDPFPASLAPYAEEFSPVPSDEFRVPGGNAFVEGPGPCVLLVDPEPGCREVGSRIFLVAIGFDPNLRDSAGLRLRDAMELVSRGCDRFMALTWGSVHIVDPIPWDQQGSGRVDAFISGSLTVKLPSCSTGKQRGYEQQLFVVGEPGTAHFDESQYRMLNSQAFRGVIIRHVADAIRQLHVYHFLSRRGLWQRATAEVNS